MPIVVGDARKLLTKEEYDINSDAIVDQAEGVRAADGLPSSARVGELVLCDGELYVCTEE